MLKKLSKALLINLIMVLFFSCSDKKQNNSDLSSNLTDSSGEPYISSITTSPKIIETTATSSTTVEMHWLPAVSEKEIQQYEVYATTEKGKT